MSWQDLLNDKEERVLPWFGLRSVRDAERSWSLYGVMPPEHGWYKFHTPGGREARLVLPQLLSMDPSWADGQQQLKGYLVGDRFIPDFARVDPDPTKLIQQTWTAYCVEPGLERFARATVVEDREGYIIYIGQDFPMGPEVEVSKAYQDRAESINYVRGVTPALDLAFRFLSFDRIVREKRREELRKHLEEEEKKRAEEERVRQLMKDAGSAVGRRALAVKDFETAAREALKVSGSELLDARPSYNRMEMIVQYRFQNRRLECVVDKKTLRVIEAGVCLTDERTGIRGDANQTLESLPGVVGEAIRAGKLVIFRHVEGDDDVYRAEDDDD